MAIRFPQIQKKLGLGVGLDMPWGDHFGFDVKTLEPTQRVLNFLSNYEKDFNYGFLSCHPKDRADLKSDDYFSAFDKFFSCTPQFKARALHHTFLNLGTLEDYDRTSISQFTNKLVRKFNIQWINEDLGLWSLKGKTLPYPLPPLLTTDGLKGCIKNVREYQEQLEVPLLVEFPGFTEGTNFFIGRMHAYDYYKELALETESPITLDTGHLISYQWLLGKRGEDLYADLERLPLDHCFEIHLSGCQIVHDRFMDFHHGIILDEQIELLKRLIPLCPNLKAITYEDPKFDLQGRLIEKSQRNYLILKEIVQKWEAA
jgi:uncharacterized protein (UPF0276 family)